MTHTAVGHSGSAKVEFEQVLTPGPPAGRQSAFVWHGFPTVPSNVVAAPASLPLELLEPPEVLEAPELLDPPELPEPLELAEPPELVDPPELVEPLELIELPEPLDPLSELVAEPLPEPWEPSG